MKIAFKHWALCLLALQGLTACGGNSSNSPLYPDLPSYNPGQNNTYTPVPDTHGYEPTTPNTPSYAVMRNIFLRVDPEVGVLVKNLEGRLEPKRAGDPIIMDDVRSFVTHVSRADLEIDQENITRLKNKFTFNYADSPIKEITVEFLPGRVRMSGKMKQVIWVPFTMEGTVSPTPDGKIQLVPDSIKVAGISVKSMLDMLRLTTAKLLTVSAERGLQFQGNNAILDPSLLFPPPQMQGRVVAVEVKQRVMRIVFDGGPQRIPFRPAPDPKASNFMHLYGGRVLIMNELQRGAELQMVDMNPSDPFDFYMSDYRRHLKAGYVKVANDQGSLITLMPDYTQLGKVNVWDGYPGGNPLMQGYSVPRLFNPAPAVGYAR